MWNLVSKKYKEPEVMDTVISALEGLRQEDYHKFEASLG